MPVGIEPFLFTFIEKFAYDGAIILNLWGIGALFIILNVKVLILFSSYPLNLIYGGSIST